jgi:hypothetical protein
MSLYSYDYDTTYEPPAPFLELTIRKTGRNAAEVTVLALVDSGADATMIPITTLQTIKARYVETRQMRGITGVAYPVDLYTIAVQIGPHLVPAVRAIAAAPDGEIIVGRDILNYLIVTLNGPAGVTEVTS